jgi:CRISPR-associated protein Csb2
MPTFEVEFLTGMSVSARPNRREEAEWPPHPDRLFQALVAAWGRNEPPLDDERWALEWLEELDMNSLVISAPGAHRRHVVTTYVPPNDARTSGKLGDKGPANIGGAVRVIPELRKNRQPRTFPTALPAAEKAIVQYVWPQAPGPEPHRNALTRLAREVTYIGNSHSLVRVAYIPADTGRELVDQQWIGEHGITLRVPFKGRLSDLRGRYEQSKLSGRSVRPTPSLVTRSFSRPFRQIRASTQFDAENATVFADGGGFEPELVAFPLVAKRLRDALLRTAQDAGLSISTLLSGHDPDGSPAREPHVAIVPLADVGWSYSRGRLMGLALLWPREASVEDRRGAFRVLAKFLAEGNGASAFRACWVVVALSRTRSHPRVPPFRSICRARATVGYSAAYCARSSPKGAAR